MGKFVLGSSSVDDHLFLLLFEDVVGTAEVDANRCGEVESFRCEAVDCAERSRFVTGLREPYRKQGASMIGADADEDCLAEPYEEDSSARMSGRSLDLFDHSSRRAFVFHDDTIFEPEKIKVR